MKPAYLDLTSSMLFHERYIVVVSFLRFNIILHTFVFL